jgi:hypothetical protein
MIGLEAAAREARAEGWTLWILVVAGVSLTFLLLAMVRRRLLRPMPHNPTDTTDAWAEAGRRLPLPPAEDKGPEAPDDKESS